MSLFTDLGLEAFLTDALQKKGYTSPTPIQEQAIPLVLAGKDMFGCAQTGTGKTAAFALPSVQRLMQSATSVKKKDKKIRSLVLTPTRELAIQIAENYTAYASLCHIDTAVIFGGVSQGPQVKQLRAGVDVVIATPGRLLDLMNQKLISIRDIEIFVLDEADRMLDMGFIRDIKKIVSDLPKKRQTLFFSATMAPEIMELAHTMLHEPETISVTPVSSTVDTIDQSLYTLHKDDKKHLLLDFFKNPAIKSSIIFSKTKHGANKIEKILAQAGIPSAAIHGNKSQTARQKALSSLKDGNIRALVATDIAARGIDVSQLSHVIIYDVPLEPESYVHRIGRTGRAGNTGEAMMFCEPEETKYLKQIIKLIGKDIPLVKDHPYHIDIDLGRPSSSKSSSSSSSSSSSGGPRRSKKKFYGRR